MNAKVLTTEERYPKYRWVILGMAWLTVSSMTWSYFLIPSLAYCLFPDLNLTHIQFTLLFTAPTLVAAFSCIPGGALADRYGIRLIVAIAAFLGGVCGLVRAFTLSFEGMFIMMCLLGIPLGMLVPNLPKMVSLWFPPREIGRLLIPSLSDRVGVRKPFLYICAVFSAVSLFYAWRLAPGAATPILIFIGGMAMGGITPPSIHHSCGVTGGWL